MYRLLICKYGTPEQFRHHNSKATLLLGGLWCSSDLWEVAELPMAPDADAGDASGTGPHLLQCPVAALVIFIPSHRWSQSYESFLKAWLWC